MTNFASQLYTSKIEAALLSAKAAGAVSSLRQSQSQTQEGNRGTIVWTGNCK